MSNRVDSNNRGILNRRSFLGLGAVATAAALVPGRAQAAVAAAPAKRDRTLSFFHTHTGERLKLAYCCDGEYQPEALAQLNHLLRDFRVNEEKPDRSAAVRSAPRAGRRRSKPISRIHIISGYRSPKTNTMLRERGGAPYRRRQPEPAHGGEGHRHPRARREARSPAQRRRVAQARRRRLLSRPRISSTSTPGACGTGSWQRRRDSPQAIVSSLEARRDILNVDD